MKKKYKTKIKNSFLHFLSILFLLFASCDGFHEQVVPIDLELENVATILVINAFIEEDNFSIVQLSYSEDIEAVIGTPEKFEENALITITTGSGLSEQLNYFNKGWYYGTEITGQTGEAYNMEIDIDGRIYNATSSMIDAPGYKDFWLNEHTDKSGKNGDTTSIYYSEEWKVNDPSDERNRYLFEWWTNGYHRFNKDWAIDDNRVVNASESLRLFNPTINPPRTLYPNTDYKF